MPRCTLGRLLSAVPVLLVVSPVAFAIIALVPGDLASEMAGPSATAEKLQRLRIQLGLDKPIPERMLDWYAALLLRGEIPSPTAPPSGCRFHTRCPLAAPRRGGAGAARGRGRASRRGSPRATCRRGGRPVSGGA